MSQARADTGGAITDTLELQSSRPGVFYQVDLPFGCVFAEIFFFNLLVILKLCK